MPKRAPIGVGNFAELVQPESNYLFADRTATLKHLVADGKVVAFHTFRRGGKTLFASMLQYFFASEVAGVKTQGLFDTLAIGQDAAFIAKYQGQYPVIMLSLKELQEDHFPTAFAKFARLVRRVYREHEYLLVSEKLSPEDKNAFNQIYHEGEKTPDKDALEDSLLELTRLLYQHHGKKVWVIIDEYDTPLTSAYRQDYLVEMALLMKNFLSAGLKDNNYLEKGVLTGILRLSKESLLSGLNNPAVYTLLNPGDYDPYFGFTEEEVKRLFAEAGLARETETIKSWYNGYQVNHQRLYNPWSIISCIHNKGTLKSYWVNTANDTLLQEALLNAPADTKKDFTDLLTGKVGVVGELSELIRFEELHTDTRSLWSLLVATGYLTVEGLRTKGVGYEADLRIPNEEIKTVYADVFAKWLEHTAGRLHYQQLLRALTKGEIDTFADLVGQFLVTYASSYDLKQENSYHMLVLGLVAALTLDYFLHSNIEASIGRPDILLIPRHAQQGSALILEFKHTKDASKQEKEADEALAQIDDRHYAAILGKHPEIKEVLKIGMAFCEKSVVVRSASMAIAPTVTATEPVPETGEDPKGKRRIEGLHTEGESSEPKKLKPEAAGRTSPPPRRSPSPPVGSS